MANLFPPRHEVIAFIQLPPEGRDFRGIILEVRVHGDHNVPLRLVKADCQGRCFSIVPAEPDDLYMLVHPLEIAEHLKRTVGAAIIDEEEFVPQVQTPERGAQLLVELFERIFLIVERNDHTEVVPGLLLRRVEERSAGDAVAGRSVVVAGRFGRDQEPPVLLVYRSWDPPWKDRTSKPINAN